MIKCSKCLQEKSSEDFAWRNKKNGKLRSHCKKCQNQYSKKHYESNPEYYKSKAHKYDSHQRNRQYVWDYLKEHPCVDCGEPNPVVLEFDHRNPEEKETNVSNLISRYSFKRLLAEIEKCDVRCANCHRKKTAIDRKYYKDVHTEGLLSDEIFLNLI